MSIQSYGIDTHKRLFTFEKVQSKEEQESVLNDFIHADDDACCI